MASRAGIPNQFTRPVAPTSPLSHEGAEKFATAQGMEKGEEERVPIADGELRQARRPGEVYDDFYLSPEDLAAYGIVGALPTSLADTDAPGDLVYSAIRAPERYGKLEPGHLRRSKLRRPTMQPVQDTNGNPVYATEDLIFVVESREEWLKRKGRHNDASYRFTNGVIEGSLESKDSPDGILERFTSDTKSLNSRKAHAKRFMSVYGQRYPKNMTYEEILAKEGAERTIEKEREFARGGRSVRYDKEGRSEYEVAAMKQSEAKKNKKFSFPGQAVK